jgi:hypothetical protein
MMVPPPVTSLRLAFRAAGFMATRTLGWSPGREDVVVGDVDLERRHPGQGPGRGPDLGREVRQRGQVVAEQRRGLVVKRSPVSCMPSPGVAGEADDHPVQLLDSVPGKQRCQPMRCPFSRSTPCMSTGRLPASRLFSLPPWAVGPPAPVAYRRRRPSGDGDRLVQVDVLDGVEEGDARRPVGRWKAFRPEMSPVPPARLLMTAVRTAWARSESPLDSPPLLISGIRPM